MEKEKEKEEGDRQTARLRTRKRKIHIGKDLKEQAAKGKVSEKGI